MSPLGAEVADMTLLLRGGGGRYVGYHYFVKDEMEMKVLPFFGSDHTSLGGFFASV